MKKKNAVEYCGMLRIFCGMLCNFVDFCGILQTAPPDHLYPGAAAGAGDRLRQVPLPRHLLQGGARQDHQAQRGQDTGGMDCCTLS